MVPLFAALALSVALTACDASTLERMPQLENRVVEAKCFPFPFNPGEISKVASPCNP